MDSSARFSCRTRSPVARTPKEHIARVVAGGAAAQSGIIGLSRLAIGEVELGDVVTSFGRHPVTSGDQLRSLLDRSRPGQSVKLKVLRSGIEQHLELKLNGPE
jgi:S1-C subfamily serine protease